MRTTLPRVCKRFHTRFGASGVVATLTLFLAMGGAAAIAGDQLASSSAKGKRGPRGPAGPAGPAGAQGPQGVQGLTGTNGTNGGNGADGKTVLSGAGAPEGVVAGNAGDFYLRTNAGRDLYGPKVGSGNTGWGSPISLKGADGNDGAAGEPWTAGGILPVGSTLTGTWSMSEADNNANLGSAFTPISFPIRLASGKPAVYVPGGGSDPSCDDGVSPAPNEDNPEAASGFLCIFESGAVSGLNTATLTVTAFGIDFLPAGGTDQAGAMLVTDAPIPAGEAYVGGWAVTG